jgi:trimeric autotransporter adhesin
VIGEDAAGNGSDTITLGNSSISAIYAEKTSITAISDRRHKKDIKDSDLGLDFIEKLRPVTYRLTNGDESLSYGFIAQEVE